MSTQTLGLCWGSVPGGGLFDIGRVAADNHLSVITITAGHWLDAYDSGLTEGAIRRRLDDLGVRVGVIDPLIAGLPGVPRADEVEEAMRRFFTFTEEDDRRVAEAVRAPVVNCAHFLGSAVDPALIRERVAEIAERNARSGILTTFEFIPGTGVPDLATALEVVSGSPHARVMFDTWHFARSDGRLDQLAALPPDAIGGMQINDRVPPPPGAAYVPMSGRLSPGEGELPLLEMLRAIEANSPGLDVCMEVFSEELKAMGWDAAGLHMARCGAAVMAAA